MAEKKKPRIKNKTASEKKALNKMPHQIALSVTTTYTKLPSAPRNQPIHSRQLLPPIVKGKDVIDETPSSAIEIDKC